MHQKILDLTKNFISIPSVGHKPEKKITLLKLIEKELAGQTFTPFASHGVPSLLYTNQAHQTKEFKLLLNAHIDVVPGKEEQFHPYEKEGKLFGRGAYDMKAATAVMIAVFKEVADKVSYPLGLQIVSDEEIGSEHGTPYHIAQGVTSDFVLGGENSELKINNEAKGAYVYQVTTRGIPAHAAYPWKGESAAIKMVQGIQKLHEIFPVPSKETWETIASVINITTDNQTQNSLPDNCTALINFRYIPADTRDFYQMLTQLFPEGTEIEQKLFFSHEYTSETNPFVKLLSSAIAERTNQPTGFLKTHARSDSCFYYVAGIPAVNFSPSGGNHHGDNEWVDVQSLEDYYHILKQFLLSIT